MPAPILATKFYIPLPRPNIVPRPRLIERLNEGLQGKLTLISAPAGFGKTTLVSNWIYDLRPVPASRVFTIDDLQTEATSQEKVVNPKSKIVNRAIWLSLDEGDNDPTRFLTYLVAAVQTLAPHFGTGVMATLQTPQPPPAESLLTTLLNEITGLPYHFILVLDDYHVVEAQAVDQALTFLLKNLPPQMHLVIATREDPRLSLARLRARGQLTELRAADLRFTPAEAAEFLNRVMGLNLSAEDIAALETRTEGWIAGLQLAALSMQGQQDTAGFIKLFTGSNRFVLDYLVEEVLQRQSAGIQTFLLRTSILDRLCGPLCEAVLRDPAVSGQETLEYLERANLFIVPLDNERCWYRYHHLFAGFLRQRLQQSATLTTVTLAEYHIRASQWYEDNGLAIEAFHHAAAANDVDRAERLIEGGKMPLHFRSVATPVLDWLASLPAAVLNVRPSLWVRQALLLLITGQTTGVEEKLQAAELVLPTAQLDDKTRNLLGQIATARATLALTRYQPETIMGQARRALEYLPPDNLPLRFAAMWTLAFAYYLQGDRAAAIKAYTEAIAISQVSGDTFSTILATSALGEMQELDNQLYAAAATYQRGLQLEGDPPLPNASQAHLGLARIFYEWNDLEAAGRHGQQSLHLARQYDRVIDRFIISEVFLARLKLAQGDVAGAATLLAQTEQSARQKNFTQRLPEIAAVQVLTLIRQGDLTAAAHLAQAYPLPLSQARVLLAQGDSSGALAVLEPLRRQMEIREWQDERLKVMVLQAIAWHQQGDEAQAMQVLGDALALAEPGSFIRIFLDEGLPMAELLERLRDEGREAGQKDYILKLLNTFGNSTGDEKDSRPASLPLQPLIEPLSRRELEILKLIALGLSNSEISARLFLALSTVKGHNRLIFDKLQVQSRTEAVARARELGLM